MSSAVSYAYRVQQEELRRQRELQAARDALLAAEQRYERLRERAVEQRQTWGDSISLLDRLAPRTASTAAQLNGAAGELAQKIAASEKQLGDEVVAARIAAFQSGMGSAQVEGAQPVTAASAIERSPRPRAEAEQDGSEAEAEEALTRLIAKLDPAADDEIATRVQAAAELVRRSESAVGREQGVGALRLLVQEANQKVREERSREALLDRSEARLNGFDGPESASVRRLVSEIRQRRRELPADLEATVDAALEQESRSLESGYVAEQLRGALEGLGYQLGPDFETTLLTSGYTQFTRSNWPGYAVRVRSGGKPPHLNFNVVRGEASRTDQSARDREVEEEFCDRQDEVIERLARAGIAAQQTRIVEPGEKPIQIVDGLEDASATEASRPAAKERGR